MSDGYGDGYGDDVAEMQRRAAEYAAVKQYVEEEKPYWVNLRAPRGEPMRYELDTYFPGWHYREAVHRVGRDGEPVPDGGTGDLHTGRTRSTVYYWANPETDGALPHLEVGEEEVVPFFGSAAAAEDYLEKRAEETGRKDEYRRYSLYKARVKKEGDAVDVLLDQAGIADFGGDG